jgi:hypothetical protein
MLEGKQAMYAPPSDKERMKVKMLEWLMARA